MFVLDGRTLRPGRAFTHNGIQYPANWLNLTTLAEKQAIGIVEQDDPTPYDGRFWWGYDSDNNLIPKQFADLGPDPVSGVTTTGTQTQWKQEQKTTAGTLLEPTDWYVIRNQEAGDAIPVGVTSFRTEVRTVSGNRETMIAATVDNGELQSLVTGAGTSSIVGYTTTLLPEWPIPSDYF
jgi:hypothetical protein